MAPVLFLKLKRRSQPLGRNRRIFSASSPLWTNCFERI